MGEILGNIKPELLWKHFEEICARPHPSRKEEKVAQYVVSVAKNNNLECNVDSFGNVVVKKPATPGFENRKTVVLQGHLDMVAEKNSDIVHDFDNDPIKPRIDNGWVKATGTTLGADNGIGVAAGLAVMESKDLQHGPLEFLFTLDEETGLNGAQSLQPGFLDSTILLNLDSEEDGALYIGCAGGKGTIAKFNYSKEEVPSDMAFYKIRITGLQGGHSGLNISEGRGNAIKIGVRLLNILSKKLIVRMSSFDGGSKHNAIPRECFSNVAVPLKNEESFLSIVKKYNDIVKKELASIEPNLKIEAVKTEKPETLIDPETQRKFINALYILPNGVIGMCVDIPGLVETSSNLAVVKTEDGYIEVTTSQRSSVESVKDDIADVIAAAFSFADADVKQGDGYPGWMPNIHSPILNVVKNTYEKLYNKEPEIKAIHAGLECGIINERYPGMDMISFGPTITGAHSPDEAVNIDTVQKFWVLIAETLKSIPVK